MKNLILLFVAVVLVGYAAGCSSTSKSHFTTNVTSFHSLGAIKPADVLSGKTFDVAHPEKSIDESLEFASYKQMIVKRLESHGMILKTDNPELLVVATFHIDGGKDKIGSAPIIGQTGGGSSYFSGTTYGYGGSSNFSGSTYSPPSYGVVGSRTYSYTVYTRKLTIEIINRASMKAEKIKRLYEAKASSAGSSGQLQRVLPYMIETVFREFPGVNGQSREATIVEGELPEQAESKP